MPTSCVNPVYIYPVLLTKEHPILDEIINDSDCNVYDELYHFESGYIMVPYDIEDNSRMIFRPKFYQALYHELYHFSVVDKYRASQRINEGMPELYSEYCYYRYLQDYIRTFLSEQELSIFFDEYMRFQNKGSYKPYYDFVKSKTSDFLRLGDESSNISSEFNGFIRSLIDYSMKMSQDSEFNQKDMREFILDCGEHTPNGDLIFEDTVTEFNRRFSRKK